jgi:uncharacterized protein YcnI
MPESSRRRVLTRASAAGVTAAAAIMLFATPAFAHITVTPGSAVAGSSSELTFHVPDEEAKSDTVRIDVQIPTDHPIAQLLAKPVPGWTVTVKTITLAKPLVTDDGSFSQAVSEVIWTGGQIAPGQFQDFSVSADPLPQGVSQLIFKAIQTYSNGDVVRWIDVPQPGQPAPDHPAPMLALTTGQAAAPVTAVSSGPSTGTASGSGSSTLALGVGIGGLLFGLAGLALAALTWRRRAPLAPEPYSPTSEQKTPVPAARTAPQSAAHAPVGLGASGRRASGSRRR